MKTRTLLLLITLCLLLSVPVQTASAAEAAPPTEETHPVRAADECGDDLTWYLEEEMLVISGSGAMDDYHGNEPWQFWKEEIRTVVFSGPVTYVGAGAFADYDVIETVDFGSALTEVGKGAFKSCDGLTAIHLPATFRRFGEESFMSCKNLTRFDFLGGMPNFRENCLWDTYATLYYPANNPWPLEHIIQLESAFQGRIQFLASDGSDPYVPIEVTEPETEPTTEPVTEPVTEPPTEPTVPPTTVPETEAPTTQPTEPETTAEPVPETTEQSRPREERKTVSGTMVGLALISGVLSFIFLGVLIFRPRRWD